MEYFTLAEDLEQIRHNRIKVSGRLFIIPLLLLLFVFLRGLNFITLEYNKAHFDGRHFSQKKIYTEDLQLGKASNETKNGNNTTNDKDSYWEYGFHLKTNLVQPNQSINNETSYIEKLIRKKISEELTLKGRFQQATVSIEKNEISGAYWIPLLKSGKNSYHIIVQNNLGHNTYFADFSGEIDLDIQGICSVDKLNNILAEKIAKVVVDSIKDDYKK